MRIIIVIFCLIFLSQSQAEEYNVLASIYTPMYDITIEPLGGTGETTYQPNLKSLLRLGLSNELIGVSWGFDVFEEDEDSPLKGNSDYTDWRFNFIFDPIQIKLFYTKYSGFYLEDYKESDLDPLAGPSYLQAKNLDVSHIGLSASWIFSPDQLSLNFLTNHTGDQAESGGSWLSGLSYTEQSFKNPEEILPSFLRGQHGVDQNIYKGNFKSLSIFGGYGYIYVHNHWFIGSLLQFGWNYYLAKYSTTDRVKSQSKESAGQKGDFVLTLGYKNHKYSVSLTASNDFINSETESLLINASLIDAELAFSTKF